MTVDKLLEFEPIECQRLDKENAAWALQYVARWRQRLETDGDDPDLVAYGNREIAAYEELLARFGQAPS